MSKGSPFTDLWKVSAQQEKARLEIVPKVEPTPTTTPTPPTPTPTPTQSPVSPEKNFTKLANSIKPEMFRGTSQKTYLALYRLTRGAIVPKRTVKLTRGDLMAAADVSEVTLVKHLNFLEKTARLIIKTRRLGDNDGATYEVFLPEEIAPPTPTPTPTPPTPTSIEKLGVGNGKNLDVGGGGETVENKDTYGADKTFLKQEGKTVDDEFAPLRALGGDWREVVGVLLDEFEKAKERTAVVSNAPAFFAEHLRRRLAKTDRAPKEKPFEPGKVEPATAAFTPDPLSEKGRANVLDTLKRMPREQVASVEDQYTAEDWAWLVRELG